METPWRTTRRTAACSGGRAARRAWAAGSNIRLRTKAAAERFAVGLRQDLAEERDLWGTFSRLADDYVQSHV
jgi:hypothetical protein